MSMVEGWQPIETAPKDGTVVLTKREYKGMVFGPYRSVWASMSNDAPMRRSAPGGLDGPIPADNEYADIPAWCSEDRRFHVPGPTHWMKP